MGQDVEAELEADMVKFLWKPKHFEEKRWKRLTLYGVGSGNKKYSTSFTFLHSRDSGSAFRYLFLFIFIVKKY